MLVSGRVHLAIDTKIGVAEDLTRLDKTESLWPLIHQYTLKKKTTQGIKSSFFKAAAPKLLTCLFNFDISAASIVCGIMNCYMTPGLSF